MQEALGDRLRASMTRLRLYGDAVDSYAQLAIRQHHLEAARDHLQAYLDAAGRAQHRGRGVLLTMSAWQVNQHITTLQLQADLARFLAGCEAKGNALGGFLKELRRLRASEDKAPAALYLLAVSYYQQEEFKKAGGEA